MALADSGGRSSATPSPSAKELWRNYPLGGGKEQKATPTASPSQTVATHESTPAAATPTAATPAPAHDPGGGSGWTTPLIIAIVVVGLAGVAVWTLVVLRRRRARSQSPPGPAATRQSTAPERPSGATGRFARPEGVTPPDPTLAWTAEMGWREERDGARFHVTASAQDAEPVTIAESPRFEWPPQDSAAVQALSRTADDLERTLLTAGWARLPAGESWYAKRFAWTPVAPAPRAPAPRHANAARATAGAAAASSSPSRPAKRARTAPAKPARTAPADTAAAPAKSARTAPADTAAAPAKPARRPAKAAPARPAEVRAAKAAAGTAAPQTARPPAGRTRNRTASAPRVPPPRDTPWPEDAHALWRAEIRWDAGYLKSRFEAVAYPPGESRGKPVAHSEAFKWLLMAPPDPKQPPQLAAARELARTLRESGWQAVGRGGAWYAERYVWRRQGEPPTQLDDEKETA